MGKVWGELREKVGGSGEVWGEVREGGVGKGRWKKGGGR